MDIQAIQGEFSAHNQFGPIGKDVARELGYSHTRFTLDELSQYRTTLIGSPNHGRIKTDNASSHSWRFVPEESYAGPDRIVFLVEGNQRQVQVVFNLLVMPVMPGDRQNYLCRKHRFASTD